MANETPPVETPNEPVVAATAPVAAAVTAPAVPDVAPAAVVAKPVEPAVVPPAEVVPPVVEPPVVVAEKYDLKMGAEPVNPQLLESLTPIFKEAGVTTKQAQAMADAFSTHAKAMIPVIAQRNLDQLRADPELGGINFARTQARVNDALAVFTTPAIRARLEARGLANDPDFVRIVYAVGRSMQDAPQTEAGPQVREKLPTQSKLYGGKDLVTSGGRAA